ncbi:Elongator complex protein 6 [Spathaspora sp. JA1]|nr:Elongator complex protein 6 [Spathaspora sp. JA1]
MSTNQPQQDLIFFTDNSLIPNDVISSQDSYLSVITHVLGTSPTWLINSLIENALVGTSSIVNTDLKRIDNRSNVIVASFSQPQEFYVKNCKKNGLDLGNNDRFQFMDCFSMLFTKLITKPEDAKLEIDGLFDKIVKLARESNTVIFIEAPEILLYATNATSGDILFNLHKLQKKCRQLFVISSKDYPQYLDFDASNPQDVSFKSSDFLIKLHHKSSLNVTLEPLSTGRAKDITGSITISRGSIPYDITAKVCEREYIYHITKDSNVKLYYR